MSNHCRETVASLLNSRLVFISDQNDQHQAMRVNEDANCLDLCQILPTGAQRIIWELIRRIYMLSTAKGARKDYHFRRILCLKICQDGRTLSR